jgi:hypothetical protein
LKKFFDKNKKIVQSFGGEKERERSCIKMVERIVEEEKTSDVNNGTLALKLSTFPHVSELLQRTFGN